MREVAREMGLVREAPKVDWARAARARRENAAPAPVKPARTKERPIAISAEPCGRCGIPGFRGCEHQLPYAEWTPPPASADDARKDKPVRKGPWRL